MHKDERAWMENGDVCVCVCVYVYERERERKIVQSDIRPREIIFMNVF